MPTLFVQSIRTLLQVDWLITLPAEVSGLPDNGGDDQ